MELMREVHGMTYPVRVHLKALGGRWDPGRRCWIVPASRYQEATDVVARQAAPRVDEADLVRQIRDLRWQAERLSPAEDEDHLGILREAALQQEIRSLEMLLGRTLTEAELWGR